MSDLSLSLPVGAPAHVADLRPVADAAATRRDTEPAPGLPVAPPPAAILSVVTPPSATARAEVGRSLLAVEAAAGERRLKPWGVAMLPDQSRTPTPDTADDPGSTSRPAEDAATRAPDRVTPSSEDRTPARDTAPGPDRQRDLRRPDADRPDATVGDKDRTQTDRPPAPDDSPDRSTTKPRDTTERVAG
jgi:hypothetical protein